jgi:HK97 family phage major capsid protein
MFEENFDFVPPPGMSDSTAEHVQTAFQIDSPHDINGAIKEVGDHMLTVDPSFRQEYRDLRNRLVERRNAVLNSMGGRNGTTRRAMSLGMSGREVRTYSLDRAVRAAASGDWRQASFEGELSNEVVQRSGRVHSRPGMFSVPWDVIVHSLRSRAQRLWKEQRDLTVATEGADVVQTTLDAVNLIDILRNMSVAAAAGADLSYTGLRDNIDIPRVTAGTNVEWLAESGAASESTPTLDHIELRPKTASAWLDYSRRFKLQSSIDAENFALNTLTADILTEVDRVFFFGSGASNEPTGVAETAGIGSVAGGANGAAPTYDHLIDLEREVSVDNADVSAMAYVTNTKVRAKMKKTPLVSSTDSRLIWEPGQKELAGYPAHVTNQIPSDLVKGSSGAVCSAILFGCWDQAILATWGAGLDILVDIYSGSLSSSFADFRAHRQRWRTGFRRIGQVRQ